MAVQKPSKHGRDHVGGGEDPIPSLAMWPIKVFRDDIAVTTGDGKFIWLIPEDLDGHTLTKVEAFNSTAGTGATTIQLRKVGVGDMLTTPITIDSGEKNSKDASAQPVVSTGAVATVAWGDHIAFDFDAAGSGALGTGVYCYFLAGPDVVQAIQGPVGPTGNTGATGPQGPQGPQGDPGGIIAWTGEWSSATTYSADDAVSWNGSSYVAIQGSTDVEPGVDAGWEDYWMVLALAGTESVSLWDAQIVKSIDETISANTTLQDDDELSFAVTANTPYFMELLLAYDTNGTADFKHAFALSSGSFTRGWRLIHGYYNVTTLTVGQGITDMTTAIPSGGSTGDVIILHITCYFLPSASATFTLQWAQNTSDGGDTTVKAGSVLNYRQVT